MNQTEFFQTIYQFCEGYIELRPFLHCTDDLTQIQPFCDAQKSHDLYFGVATRDGKAGRAENVIDVPCVWCDADFNKVPKEILSSQLKRFPFKPSIIVESGGGVHFYWLLKEPSREYIAIEDINRRITFQLKGDPNSCDIARVLRIPNTINHKYPALCKVRKNYGFRYDLDTFLDVLPKANISAKSNGGLKIKDPEWLSSAMKGVEEGDRNATGARIAGYWINKLDPDEVMVILKTWNSLNSPPLSGSDIEKIVSSVSRYKPELSIDPIEDVYDAQRMLTSYKSYIQTLKQNKFTTGITNIDEKIRGVAGGEVLTIIARAGSFKTALLQNLLKNYVQNSNMGAIFFSLEMPVSSITERYFEMISGFTGNEVEQIYLDPLSDGLRSEWEPKLMAELPNFYVVQKKIGLCDISKYIKVIEKHYKVKVGVVGIDYMGLMDAHGSNEYEVISNLAKGIKITAKSIGLPIIMLSQVSRKGGEGETEITMDHGRGSGAIEEAADFILGLWQVEKSSNSALIVQEHKYDLVCKILKNRKGPRGSKWILNLDPSTFAIGSDSKEYAGKPKQQDKW
jgi:hypothetical protein